MGLDELRSPEVDSLIETLLSIEDPETMFAFLQDLCTVREIQDMAQRLKVARMLVEGAHYNDIQEATGASTTTISRVNRALNYGADGYRRVIEPDSGEEG